MLPVSCADGLLVALAVARFGIAVHDWKLVTAVTTTGRDCPAAKSPKLQLSTFAATLQPAVAVVHVRPPGAGSGSFSVTLFAVPGPALLTTMVNVAVSPALIVAPSGVLTILRFGG